MSYRLHDNFSPVCRKSPPQPAYLRAKLRGEEQGVAIFVAAAEDAEDTEEEEGAAAAAAEAAAAEAAATTSESTECTNQAQQKSEKPSACTSLLPLSQTTSCYIQI